MLRRSVFLAFLVLAAAPVLADPPNLAFKPAGPGLYDFDTGTFLGDREVLLRDQDGVPAGTAVRWTSVTSSVVDEAPEGGSVCGRMTVDPETGQC